MAAFAATRILRPAETMGRLSTVRKLYEHKPVSSYFREIQAF